MKGKIHTYLLPVLALAATGLSSEVRAQVMVQNVPDWNQPTLADPNLPDPGPAMNLLTPPGAVLTAWCAPTASANIMGYYRDKFAVPGIGDAFAFPATSPQRATDWRDGSVDNLSAGPSRQDLGWFFNTNNQGDPANPFGIPGGTHYGAILPGLLAYFATHNAPALVVNYADLTGVAAAYDTSGDPAPHTVPQSYLRLQMEVDAQRPALLHLGYWNIANRMAHPMLPGFDIGLWGGMVPGGPGGEAYGTDIGHTVTVVGYMTLNDPMNPWAGQVDAIIVHDNADGTLAGGLALPLVLPYGAGLAQPGFNVPWVMQTEISGVPEPALAAAILAALALGAVALRRRMRKG